jgi:hypothetical protein
VNRHRLVMPGIVVGVLAIAGGLGWGVGAGRLDGTRTALDERVQVYRDVLLEVRAERERRPELDERTEAITNRTLGGDLETVDSALRRRLVETIEENGLSEVVVNTLGGTVIETPAGRSFKRSGPERALRDEPDFVLVRATASGSGSIADVVRFLHALDAAPWVKRIEQVRMDPDRTGRRISVSVRLATIFVPGATPDPEAVEEVTPRRSIDRYAAMVAANPFRLEAAPSIARPTPTVPTPVVTPPTADPWSGWMLTGVIEGDPGVEAWCRHAASGRTATLLPETDVTLGDGLVATLVSVDGDVAVLRVGGETRRVLVGSTLDRSLP